MKLVCAENKQYWKHHGEKEFRLKIRSKEKRRNKRKGKLNTLLQFSQEKNRMKSIRTFHGLIAEFLPRNLLYLLVNERCQFYADSLEQNKIRKVWTIKVPENFSIVEQPKESYDVIKKICSCFYHQCCLELILDYDSCRYTDLLTQVFLDAVLMDIDRFLKICHRPQYRRYKIIKNNIRLNTIGGKNYNDSILRMINSVGSPANIINRRVEFPDVIPFRLIRYDGIDSTDERRLGQKEHDTTLLIDYINDCLSRVHKELTKTACDNLGYVVGETLINAEQHSTLKYRYVIGYFEENTNKDSGHFGLFNLVIMNFGKTIYEKFKYPAEGEAINEESVREMEKLSGQFKWKKLFNDDLTEETLWTLYSLQRGVSCIPASLEKRGNGTIKFIESFFKIKGNPGVDNISHMYLLSGSTRIDFDGTYRVQTDEKGKSLGRITFNDSGSFQDKPNNKYVKHVDSYFPGTAIFVKLLIDDNDIKDEK